MLYFSDHGADPYRKRNPDAAGFKALQIPMFIYVSDEYKQLFGDSVAAFKEHRNAYFTNDLTYEVVCNLLQIKSNHYNEDIESERDAAFDDTYMKFPDCYIESF